MSLLVIFLFYIQKIRFIHRFIEYFAFDSIEQLTQRWKKRIHWLFVHKSYFLVAAFFYCFTFVQIFVLEPKEGWKETIQVALKIFTQRQAPMILTIIIIMGFFFLLLLISNRFWYALTATLIINLLLTISTVIKMEMREEPVFPSDLKMLTGLSELLSMVSPVLLIVGGLILLLLLITSIIVQRRLQKQYSLKIHWKRRFISIAVLLGCFSGVFFINHKNSPSFLLFNLFKVNKTFFNQQGAVKDNGPVIQFLNNIDSELLTT